MCEPLDVIAHLDKSPMASCNVQEKEFLAFIKAADNDRGIIVPDAILPGWIARENYLPKSAFRRWEIVTAQPRSFDHIALGGHRVLLVLGGPYPAAKFAFFVLVPLRSVPLRLQKFAQRPS